MRHRVKGISLNCLIRRLLQRAYTCYKYLKIRGRGQLRWRSPLLKNGHPGRKVSLYIGRFSQAFKVGPTSKAREKRPGHKVVATYEWCTVERISQPTYNLCTESKSMCHHCYWKLNLKWGWGLTKLQTLPQGLLVLQYGSSRRDWVRGLSQWPRSQGPTSFRPLWTFRFMGREQDDSD